jgi:non-haem Fe2+, alpha-ketoglutarate-dependent halogenase
LECPIDPQKVVTMEMKAGQFVIFTEQTIHGSPPNRSNRPRRGMAFRVIPPEVVAYGDATVHRVSYLKEKYDLTHWGEAKSWFALEVGLCYQVRRKGFL